MTGAAAAGSGVGANVDGAGSTGASAGFLAAFSADASALGAAGLAPGFEPDVAGAGLAGASAASLSRSFFTTGASIVDEADETNSPMSFSVDKTFLLSSPSSRASS